MSEVYKLIFRGEVLEGQHAAVVRRRLGELLAIDDARLDRLFSGQPVIVKAEADAEAAARFQGLFRKAGALLRVVPVPSQQVGGAPAPQAAASGEAPAGLVTEAGPGDASEGAPGAGFAPELLPVGSDVLREDEREIWLPRETDTTHLSLQDPDQPLPEPAPAPAPPDTSGLRLLDLD